jgi:hypothetical protein
MNMSQRQSDLKWKKLCESVDRRDTSDRLSRCLTAGEMKLLGLKSKCRLDRCHALARSISPENIYNIRNVYRINSYSHNNLDNCQNPLTGDPISRNERDYWWWRIINKSTEKFDPETDYETLVKSYIASLGKNPAF